MTESPRATPDPCPFCGKTPRLVTKNVEPQGDPWYGRKDETFVLCDCGACLFDGEFHEGFYDADTRAIAAWNRRATPDQGSAELSDAAAALKRAAETISKGLFATATQPAPSAEPLTNEGAIHPLAAADPLDLLVDEVGRMRRALDAIYGHNEVARSAVAQHYGLHHRDISLLVSVLRGRFATATQGAPSAEPELPPLPLIAMEDCLPYDAIGVPGYPVSYVREYATNYAKAALAHRAAATQGAPTPAQPAEFTDTGRDALLWVLWHHQGGSSKVGQPIRFALGKGQHERLTDDEVTRAKRWGAADFNTFEPLATGIHPTPEQAQGSEENRAGAVRAGEVQQRIMKIPPKRTSFQLFYDPDLARECYEAGHRDARHAAAELVIAAIPPSDEPLGRV